MPARNYSTTERIGVNAVEQAIVKSLGWIFREQPVADFGIDAHLEVVANEIPAGRLIALQIKTGASHFADHEEHLTYYGENAHLEYWTKHSLPVLLVAHLPESNKTYWALVSPETTQKTNRNWKIDIPKAQELGHAHKDALVMIAGGEQSARHVKLVLDRGLMEALREGKVVSIEFMEWLHKSLNRTPLKVISTDRAGKEEVVKDWHMHYSGYSIQEVMTRLFPWADTVVDENYYAKHLDEGSLDEMYDTSTLFAEQVYPFRVLCNEAAEYRLKLRLNSLGKAFLVYMDYLDAP